MGERIRAFDWSKTPLGPAETWPPALRMTIRFLLVNRFPSLLCWGPQYVSIYNDPYRQTFGDRRPWALGQRVSECWKEIWRVHQPLIDTPFKGGPATWDDDLFLEINRHGFVEETHFTIGYSPAPDETVPSGVGGVLATMHEITEKVVGERRVAALHDLSVRAAEAETAEEACRIAAQTLARHDRDVPFALLYLIDSDRRQARLAGSAGLAAHGSECPPLADLDEGGGQPWPLGEVARTERMQVVGDLVGRLGSVPPGPWSDPPREAVALPIKLNMGRQLAGVLVAGVSARLKLDDLYRSFYELIADHIAATVANARACEEEKKRAEALAEINRESEERFRALVKASSDVVYRMCPDWTEMRQLIGRDFIADTDEPSRFWLQKYIHPDDQPRVLSAIHDAIGAKSVFELEHRVLCVHGGWGWTFSRAIPILDATGEITEWFGVASNITARKQAEEALREREVWLRGQREALEAAVNGAPLETSLSVLVRTATEGLGQNVRAAFYIANDEGTALHHVVGMTAGYAEAVDGFKIGPGSLSCGLATHTGKPVLTSDVTEEPRWGPWLWLAEKFDFRGCWSFPVRNGAGKFIGTLAVYSRQPREATERDQQLAMFLTHTASIIISQHRESEGRKAAQAALCESEERLRTIVDTAVDAIIIIDETGRIESVNPAATRILGYAPAELVGNTISMVTPEWRRLANDSCVSRFPDIGREVEGWRKDGASFPADLAVAEWRLNGKRHFSCVMRDVTERRRREEQIRLLLKEVNHRAKNLLGVVQVVAWQTAIHEPVNFVERFSERLRSLAASQDLFVRNEWGGVGIDELVRSQLAHFRDVVGSRITLHGPPTRLAAKAAQSVGMMLHELATNAGKYGALSNGSGRVTISWRLDPAPLRGDRFALSWIERGGPPVIAPTKRGFGSTVIEMMPKVELDSEIAIEYAPEGLSWRMSCPAERVLEPTSARRGSDRNTCEAGDIQDGPAATDIDRRGRVSAGDAHRPSRRESRL